MLNFSIDTDFCQYQNFGHTETLLMLHLVMILIKLTSALNFIT